MMPAPKVISDEEFQAQLDAIEQTTDVNPVPVDEAQAEPEPQVEQPAVEEQKDQKSEATASNPAQKRDDLGRFSNDDLDGLTPQKADDEHDDGGDLPSKSSNKDTVGSKQHIGRLNSRIANLETDRSNLVVRVQELESSLVQYEQVFAQIEQGNPQEVQVAQSQPVAKATYQPPLQDDRFNTIEGRFDGLEHQLFQTAVINSIPNFHQITQSQQWATFKNLVVPGTRYTYGHILKSEDSARSAEGVRAVFDQFRDWHKAQRGISNSQPANQKSLKDLATPGKAATAKPGEKRFTFKESDLDNLNKAYAAKQISSDKYREQIAEYNLAWTSGQVQPGA
jgi:uncharacterized coiled-coil protein SlyX